MRVPPYANAGVLRVFVLCPSYHGATLLALLLSEHRDVADLGDTNPLTDSDAPCTCGLSVRTCDFWLRLHRELEPPLVAGDTFWFPKRPPFTRSVRANTVLSYVTALIDRVTAGHLDWVAPGSLARYRDAHNAMVQITVDVWDARVFVDGEKMVEKALVLRGTAGGPVRAIHLTRDPRGYAYSGGKRSGQPSDEATVTRRLALAKAWRRYHWKARLAARLLGSENVLTVRYEDLAADTGETMARVFRFIGVSPLGPESQRRPQSQMHTIGNRMLKTFDGSVHLDDAWRGEIPESEAAAILRESGPFAARLGYR